MLCDIKVGLSCNNACVHCIMEPVKKAQQRSGNGLDADTASVKGLIASATERGFSHITLTGGEVTVRPDFSELVLFALAQGLTVVIQTNGRQLARPSRRAFLKQVTDPDRVQFVIALHGPEEAIHDAVTRRPGSFRQTIRGIESLREDGFRVCGKLVISRINLSGIVATLRLLKCLDVDEGVVAFPHAEDFPSQIFHQVVPRYDAVAAVIQAILAADPATLPLAISYETIPYCVVRDVRFWRSSLDLVFLQERMRGSQTLIEMLMTGDTIDWSTARGQIKTKPAACGDCLLDPLCEGPWLEYVTHFGDEEFQPVTDRVLVNQFIEAI
ncbi:MAG TPA: radical SAM protein [Candidatus Competibacteraceae bacterium]|nr:radical SAM protein [Candidatus Competibacteraceae bacterium]